MKFGIASFFSVAEKLKNHYSLINTVVKTLTTFMYKMNCSLKNSLLCLFKIKRKENHYFTDSLLEFKVYCNVFILNLYLFYAVFFHFAGRWIDREGELCCLAVLLWSFSLPVWVCLLQVLLWQPLLQRLR